jgi:putative flippase GtrA
MVNESKSSVGKTGRQIALFGAVGVVGFLVDAGVLHVAVAVGLGLYIGRAVSFLCAVSVTWILNRRFTFQGASNGSALSQWGRFVVSQLSGAAINLGVYAALVRFSALVAQYPSLGVAIGSLSGLLVNFSVARAFVFKRSHAGNT